MISLGKIPIIRLLLPFILGIIAAIYTSAGFIDILYLIWVTSLFIYLLLIGIKHFRPNYNWRWVSGVVIHVNLFLGAFLLTKNATIINTNHLTHLIDKKKETYLIAEIDQEPRIRETFTRVILDTKKVKKDEIWIESSGKVIAYLKNDVQSGNLSIGDIIVLKAKPMNIPPPKNPHEFNYQKYLHFQSIHQQIFVKEGHWALLQRENNFYPLKIASSIRKYLIQQLKTHGIQDENLAITSALVLGYKDQITQPLRESYANAGAMHVLAVSGLHVGVIFFLFSWLLTFLNHINYGKVIKGMILLCLLWFYALLTGLSPSILRATIMFSLIILASVSFKRTNIFNTVACSALFLLLYNPLFILNVGFQLSYLAVFGILIIQPGLYALFTFKSWFFDKIWQVTTVSIAAQIATFPVGLFYFHQFPSYFLLSNPLVLLLAVFILYLGLACFLSIPVPTLLSFFCSILDKTVGLLNSFVTFIQQLPFSVLDNVKFESIHVWISYFILISLIALFFYRRYMYLLVSVVFGILFLSLYTLDTYRCSRQKKLVIYHIPKHSAFHFIDGNEGTLLLDEKLFKDQKKLLFHAKNSWTNSRVNAIEKKNFNAMDKKGFEVKNLYVNDKYIQFYDARIAVIDNHFKAVNVPEKLVVDLILLRENKNITLKELLTMYAFNEIVMDASIPNFQNYKLLEEAKKRNIKIWSIAEKGAFIMNV